MENNSGFERFKGEKELNIREASHVKEDILGRLKAYSQSNYVPMHMPGAKRNTELFYMDNPYGLDITEIDGFDNMLESQGSEISTLISHRDNLASLAFNALSVISKQENVISKFRSI